MKVLVTGSSGHLGEALVRVLREANQRVVGLDAVASTFTDTVGSITDRDVVKRCVRGAEAVIRLRRFEFRRLFVRFDGFESQDPLLDDQGDAPRADRPDRQSRRQFAQEDDQLGHGVGVRRVFGIGQESFGNTQ